MALSSLNSAANQIGSLSTDSSSTATTLPSWYSTAQQNLVNQATSNAANTPQLQNTVAGQAINMLSGPNNPFNQAQNTFNSVAGNTAPFTQAQTGLGSVAGNTAPFSQAQNMLNTVGNNTAPFSQAENALNTFASGAANPFIVNADGSVSPNTNTAMGGLFAAQNQKLNQALPELSAQTGAGGTASGQFGSLRGQTAQENAIANALATTQTAQNQAALNNQQTGASAAANIGNVGAQQAQAQNQAAANLGNVGAQQAAAQTNALNGLGNVASQQATAQNQAASGLNNVGQYGTAAETTLGQAQQASPLTSTANLASILGTVQAPTTVTNTKNLSPLTVLQQGQSLLGSMSAAGGLGKIATNFGNLLSSAFSAHMKDATAPDAPISLFSHADGGSVLVNKKSRRAKNTHKEIK
jgi:hypothetical protein